jgi:uncharacterized membrane protein YczE
MRAPPRLRGGLPTRLCFLLLGLLLFAAGIVALLESRLGLSPWDVLHQGIARHTPLSFGAANIAVSVVVVTVAWALGARIGIGTAANAVLVGTFVQLLGSIDAVARLGHEPLVARIGLLFVGLALMGAGTGLYIGPDLGAGPRDSLMVVGARRTRFRIGVVRASLELSVLVLGVALGGTVGIGTLVFAFAIGPMVELTFWLLERSPLALRPRVTDATKPPNRGQIDSCADSSPRRRRAQNDDGSLHLLGRWAGIDIALCGGSLRLSPEFDETNALVNARGGRRGRRVRAGQSVRRRTSNDPASDVLVRRRRSRSAVRGAQVTSRLRESALFHECALRRSLSSDHGF